MNASENGMDTIVQQKKTQPPEKITRMVCLLRLHGRKIKMFHPNPPIGVI